MPLHLDTLSLLGKYALVFGYHLLEGKGVSGDARTHDNSFEYLYDTSLPMVDYLSRERRQKIKLIALGSGCHRVPYKGRVLEVCVGVCLGGRVLQVHNDEIIKHVDVRVVMEEDESLMGAGGGGEETLLIEFADDAKKHVTGFMDACGGECHKVKKYLYDVSHGGDWEFMHASPKRKLDSVFLPREEKARLEQFIADFRSRDVREEYARFNIPYKFNLLLYGVPGSGKSSTINAIASELDSDVAIMSFSQEITDTHMIKAVSRLVQLENCKIVVMEDIDCLFANRKEHDTSKNSVSLSGLLNVLDGVSRAEGLVVCMTTNNIEAIDEAMMRAGRVDLCVRYDAAAEQQVRDMLRYYFGGRMLDVEVVDRFCECIKFKSVTTSMLQQYLFEMRKEPERICDKIERLYEKKVDKVAMRFGDDGIRHMYM